MNGRETTSIGTGLAILAVAAVLLAGFSTQARSQPALQAGRDYVRLDPPQPVSGGDRIEVIEFFYYGCPVCYELEPMMKRWAIDAPGDVRFRRIPAFVSASWEPLARLHFALEELGELDRLHWPVYEGIHFEGVDLGDEAQMQQWAAQNGIEAQKFRESYRSPGVEAKLAEAREMVRRFGVKGVPSIAVDGRYLTSARMAGGTRTLLPVLDRLVEQARKDRAK